MGMCMGRMGRHHHGEWHSSPYPSSYPVTYYDDYPPTSSGVGPQVSGVSAHVNPRYAGDDYYYNGGASSGGYIHDRVRPASIGQHTYHSGHSSYRDGGVYHDPYY